MAERQFGPYRLVRQIAVGGMAEIHLAKTKGIAGFEKYVALKMIHPNFAEDEQFIQMLVDEAKIAVQLTHGNIAQTFDLGRVGETYYITMEYVDGADLYKVLRRGSEQDLEMPLDVCAFVGKEIASALDHAHRKKDHTGKPLGIVHRDVSPQNVLISYSGEVKLVDFGIAKATMKARQTAVGVIKGKYYYMSPEQAWGDRIDARSDIFSAGIVLYEMLTGQMLYLEEDLHKLLDMARKADIAPPSKLRRGIPPQLEKIVMHALEKLPGDRYQSAGDFASDLERFLHAYSPVFTAAKLSGLLKQVVGDPLATAAQYDLEVHEGVNATHTLDIADLKEELRDENSVIFRVEELKKPTQQLKAAQPAKVMVPPKVAVPTKLAPAKQLGTRATAPTEPPPVKGVPPSGNPGARVAAIPSIAKPRQINDETRQLESPPLRPGDEVSGLLMPQKITAPAWDARDTVDSDADELENIGERTMITAPSGGGYMMDGGDDDAHPDATMISDIPQPDDDTGDGTHEDDADEDEDAPTLTGTEDEEGPTVSRDFRDKPRAPKGRSAAPAALAAKIHAPAVSELRKPRPSKRTPQGGVPAAQGNVLQQLVNRQVSEPMPVPRQVEPQPQPPPPQAPTQFPHATPGGQPAAPPGYMSDASGMPLGLPTPVGITAEHVPQQQPGYPPQPGYAPQGYPPQGYPPQGYPPQGYPPQGYPPQGYPPQGYPPQGYPPQGYPPPGYPPQGASPASTTPGALYQFQPQGGPAPTPMSLTGQMRLFEVDELPSQYKLGAASKRWFTYIVAGVIAISVAAGVTFFIIRSTQNSAPTTGKLRIESEPKGAEITLDGTRLTDRTPHTVDGVPVGTHHTVTVELPRYKPYQDTVDVPQAGGEVGVMALLKPITGKLVINTVPGGAEIRINDQIRGRTPTTITDVDMESARHVELRLKDYQPYAQDLTWPANGQIQIDIKLKR